MPLVSVLMPVYNASEFLKEAIDSILRQTFTDFELILINDGSTDNSEAIINSYSDKRINYYYQPNAGVASALNAGIKQCSGKYIWRHDADDTCLPFKLETQVNFLELNPDVALCGTQIAFMTSRGKIAWNYRQPKNVFFEGKPFKEVTMEDFNPYSPITHATILVRKKVITELGGYRKAFLTSEDYDLWLRILDEHKAVVLNECNYFVRLNAASATQTHSSSLNFYMVMALAYAKERKEMGSDPLMRQEKIPFPEKTIQQQVLKSSGRMYRGDLLSYTYKIAIDASDVNEITRIISLSLKDGWKVKNTWKSVVIPLLGPKFTATIVEMKKSLKV